MCTILTIDSLTYRADPGAVTTQILDDSIYNADGASLIFVDSENPENNTVLRTMSVTILLASVAELMSGASDTARLFVHLRAATTNSVGVGYTHAFDNWGGKFVMHNGVIGNKANYAVDSFNLIYHGENAESVNKKLVKAKEEFANIFWVDTENWSYAVIRRSIGSLHTDGKGNFSTHAFGAMISVVPNGYFENFVMAEPLQEYSAYDFDDEFAEPWYRKTANDYDEFDWDEYCDLKKGGNW